MVQSPAVLQRIHEQACRTPQAVALRRCDGSSILRYGDLFPAVDSLAEDLRAEQVSAGSRVMVFSDNGPETYLAVLACARIGAVAVMVDGEAPPATIERFSQITDPAAVLLTPRIRQPERILVGAPTDVAVITVEIDTVARQAREDLSLVDRSGSADDPLAMVFTSGTTGEPKAVLLAHRTFYAIADLLNAADLDWVDWVVGETTYSPLPATHIGGLWWILNCLMQGSQCVTGGENTASMLELLNDNAVASTCLVPTLLSRLVAEVRSSGAPLPSSLRLVGYGGSRAVAADIEFVEATGIRTAQVYGLSETGCTALCLPTEDQSIARVQAGAVGRPYPGVQVHLDGDGSGPPHGAGQTSMSTSGTMWIKSPANMLGYWNNPGRTAEVLVDGWVNTGDLLDLGDDGFYYIRGRSSEMIICGGVNVAPDEVDRIAADIAGVRDAACYEIPDDEFGALVGLAVVPTTTLDTAGTRKLKQAIAARYRTQSESAARPSRIDVIARIPRTASGKVMRTSLAAAVSADA
ncbi:MAG: fatty acid--CoA ligase FadD10 [Mycobacterium sp.]|nr:fatty acid--CoA ligase FadD10 [Mycobacterium sp.]